MEKTKLFRVGGLSADQIKEASANLREWGGHLELLHNNVSEKRFGAGEEYSVRANAKGVLGLLQNAQVNLGACRTPETRLFRVGGLTAQELQDISDRLKESGGQVELLSNKHSDKRFSSEEEYTVLANDKGVLRLLQEVQVNVGACQTATW